MASPWGRLFRQYERLNPTDEGFVLEAEPAVDSETDG